MSYGSNDTFGYVVIGLPATIVVGAVKGSCSQGAGHHLCVNAHVLFVKASETLEIKLVVIENFANVELLNDNLSDFPLAQKNIRDFTFHFLHIIWRTTDKMSTP